MTAIVRKDGKVSLEEAREFQSRLNEPAELFIIGDTLPESACKVISLGGDGTAIACASHYPNLPILSVNYGHLGFLSALEKGDDPNQEFKVLERGVLRNSLCPELALNEVVIARGNLPTSLRLAVYVDEVLLTKYLADGVIIATTTGSTAYSLSANGPLISPDVEGIIITPICPHFRKSNSFVFAKTSNVRVKILDSDEARLTVDGHFSMPIKVKETVEIGYSERKVKFLYRTGYSFVEKLAKAYKR